MPRERFTEFAHSTVPTKHRDYVFRSLEKLKHKYPKISIPHVGNFEFAQMCVEAGYSASNIIASDIFLYPAIIARYVNDLPFDDLYVCYLDEWMQRHLKRDRADHLLLAIKIAQVPETNYYYKKIVEEIKKHRNNYLNEFEEKLDILKSKLVGIKYKEQDFLPAIKEGLDVEESIMWINPPKYSSEFLKVAKFNDKLEWKGVKFEKFKPIEAVPRILEASKTSKALVMMRPHFLVGNDLKCNLIHAVHLKPKEVDYLYTNKPEEFKKEACFKALSDIHPSDWAIMPIDYEIPVDAKIQLISVDKNIGLYYRDLFAHKLGATRSERYYLGLLNEYIFCVFGVHAQKFEFGHADAINETFGFTCPSKRYRRLNRLFMMSLICGDAHKAFIRDRVWSQSKTCKGVRTVCLSTYPELKVNRGIMKLMRRDKVKDGNYNYKLHYYADFNKKTFSDVLKEFLIKHGDK